MQNLKLTAIASLSMASLAILTSCQDEDFGYTAEQISYRTNFDKKFGKASNIPTFDLSSYNLNKMGLMGGPANMSGTRALNSTFFKDETSWFEVPDELITWLDTNLPEKGENTSKGTTNFTLAMPGNDIIIVPIYQGQAGLNWELWMNNGTYDEMIWTKSEGIMVRSATQQTGQTAYTNTTVGDVITINSVAFQQMNSGNGDFYVPIFSALQSAGFDPDKEWFSVTVSGVQNKNGSSFTGQGGIQVNWKTVDGGYFSNGGKTINVQDETVLQTWSSTTSGEMQLRLAIWQNTLNTGAIPTITIQRYEKTSGGTDYTWSKLTAIDFESGHTIEKHIKTNAIRISRDQFTGQFELYLKVKNKGLDGGKWADREKQSSKDGQMIAITSLMQETDIVAKTRAEVIKMFGNDEYEIMFLGCEDSNTSYSDWDMNDVCFLIIGRPGLPPVIEGEDKYYSKRYLIEDLGSTFDFDFNDIVVDVEEVVCTHSGEPHKHQTATLKHLCGTIPFQIGFGDIDGDMLWFDPMPGNNNGAEQGEVGYTPSGSLYASLLGTTDNLNGHWDRDKNNIYVRVWPSQAGATPSSNAAGSWEDYENYLRTLPGKVTTFPEKGQYPYIIATDQNVHWMRELITIPENWFSVYPKNDPTEISPNVPIPGLVEVTGVSLNVTNRTIDLETPYQLIATIAPVDATDKSMTWSSSNTSVATVNSNGLVTGIASGTATITVTTTDGNKTATCTVTVDPDMEPEEVTGDNVDITLGQRVNRKHTAMSQNSKVSANQLSGVNVGDKIVIDLKDVTNTAKIQILEMGSWGSLVGSTNLNNATRYELEVTSSNINNIKNGIDIQGNGFNITKVSLVTPKPAANLSVTSTSHNILVGNFAEVGFNTSSNVAISVASSNESVATATIDGNKVKISVPENATSGATATITLSQEESDGYTAGSATITVTATTPVAATGISIDKTTLDLTPGKDAQLVATIAPTNATNKNVTWSISGSSNITIDQTGKVSVSSSAEVNETATVTVTSEDGSFTATCVVTVIEAPTEIILWTGTVVCNWQEITLGSDNSWVSSLKAGDKIIINTSSHNNNYQIKFRVNNQDVNNLAIADQSWAQASIGDDGKAVVVLTENNVNSFKATTGDVKIQCNNITLTSVSILPKDE